jgi:MtN3 and saliva related transmembrane protein
MLATACPVIPPSVEIIGFCAAFCTTFAFVPQVIRSWRSKSAKDISLLTILTFMTGITLWMLYGLSIGARPIVTANCVTLALQSMILYLKFRYG